MPRLAILPTERGAGNAQDEDQVELQEADEGIIKPMMPYAR
jgi:hypothetical protein